MVELYCRACKGSIGEVTWRLFVDAYILTCRRGGILCVPCRRGYNECMTNSTQFFRDVPNDYFYSFSQSLPFVVRREDVNA